MSYDCDHKPPCVNQRHHVERFYTERSKKVGSISLCTRCWKRDGHEPGCGPDEDFFKVGGDAA